MTGTPPGDPYLSAEDRARVEIDRMLIQAGWVVQHAAKVNLGAGLGVAVREFVLQKPHGRRRLPVGISAPIVRLPFSYESTGAETRFTNLRDPEPRSRRLVSFHRPETLRTWIRDLTERPKRGTLRARLREMPVLERGDLWEVQATAIDHIEESLRDDRPRSLVQMATGSGKTLFAIPETGRKLTQEYVTQRLQANRVDTAPRVCISTIQRRVEA